MACSGEGLSTSEALSRLHEDIATSLDEYQKSEAEKNKGFGLKSVLYEAFHHKSYISVFRWTSALALIVEGVVLLVAFAACNDPRYHHLPAESFFIVVAVMLNVYLVWWDTQLRHKELPRLTQNVLNDLKEFQSSVLWCAENYPHLHSPLSPCITLQWTRRDGHTVNLPWSLLVRGDIIYLKPGQKVPARCKPMQTSYTGGGGEILMGDIYSPNLEGVGEGFSSPKARTPLKAAPYVLLETPYITNLKILLTEALNRPVTVFNKQRFYLFSWAMESVILPVVLGLILVINALRVYYGNWVGDWTEALLIGPVCVALPLIPLGLPLAWLLLNWLGIARILTMYHHANKLQSDPVEDPFEDAELEALQFSEMSVKWLELRRHFILTICGKEPSPIRTANVLHVLASVTNLCCVDKKGVLSWPNPTAEKVFFLKNRAHNLASSAPSLYGDNVMFEEVKAEKVTSSNPTKESESVLMSLTHDHQTAFGLQFDDPMWRRYLLSLKPLGLNILLNTCNPATQKHYTQFCAHITCEAMYNEDLVPVSQRSYVEHGCEHRHVVHMDIPVCSRGCLCELAKQIGFSEQAQEPFELEHQLSTFRHVPPDMACKDRLARSLMITKLKFPFPHMVSVLVRDRASRKLELMSQGTADIVLDSCTDYWDGYDICPLTDKDRKKILDFYHRTSLSAYCTAFSYRPTSCVVRGNLTNIYMELPIDPTHLYNAARTPTPHISTEALFGDEEHTEYEEIDDIDDAFRMQCKQIFIGMVTMQYQAKTDMVQMIEQLDASCIRFVHFSKENELRSRVFSEKMGLESGWNCHISLLSDRTRTESGNSSGTGAAGSIKTSGLTLYRQSTEDITNPHLSKTRFRHDRSQWRNCQSTRFCLGTRTAHAWRSSLEVSRALSHSAPSAINLEVAQVKFEEEVSICSEFSQSQTSYLEDEDDQRLGGFGYNCPGGTSEECMIVADEEHMCNAGDTNSEHHSHVSGQSRSPSRGTDSTEHSASFNFDMSNRARLPKGIENIKPHLENVDNVPLLVSLFTDCTPPATCAMLTIMQEYTEVTMVMGSSANADNMRLFMQADASLSVDPLYPQVCMREAVFVRPPLSKGPPPTEVARSLNVLPCSLAFQRDDRVSLVHLIMESRHYMQQVMSCVQFWACCCLSLTFLQLLAATAALPPLLSSGDVVWIVSVIIPIISVSLVAAPTNRAVMNQATGKNVVILNKQIFRYVVLYYICKFIPSVAVILLCGGLTLASFCWDITSQHNSSCIYVYPNAVPIVYNNSTKYDEQRSSWSGWGDKYADSLDAVQNGVAFLLVLYFCMISISFVHRMYQLWTKNPLTNRWWASSVIAVLVLQIVYGSVSLSGSRIASRGPGLSAIPAWLWLMAFIWPFLLIPLNEVIKRREIRVNVRYQKRARLEFGTKLGMNSPF